MMNIITWCVSACFGLSASLLCANPKMSLSEAYKQAQMIEALPNIVFDQPTVYKPPMIAFQVEVLSESELKYEAKTFNGMKALDRRLCRRSTRLASSTGFPAHYGFTPGRINTDGDPLDVLVLGGMRWFAENRGKKHSPPRGVRLIGIVKMEECEDRPCLKNNQWVQDWKLLAVDQDEKEFAGIEDANDLLLSKRKQIEDFFSFYKGFDGQYPKARVTGFGSAAEALSFYAKAAEVDAQQRQKEVKACKQLVLSSAQRAEEMLSMAGKKTSKEKHILELKPSFDKNLVSCLERTFHPEVFANPSIFKAYLAISAYHLIGVKLKAKKKLSLLNSLELMAKLRKKKKKHYRFVGLDTNKATYKNPNGFLEKIGSGQPILGWSKTKNRAKGCIGKTSAQHYDSDDLIGVEF